jgi:hypothetical protein
VFQKDTTGGETLLCLCSLSIQLACTCGFLYIFQQAYLAQSNVVINVDRPLHASNAAAHFYIGSSVSEGANCCTRIAPWCLAIS